MADCVIIANPAAGSRAAPVLATRVKDLLQAAGRSVELRLTAAPGDARRLAAEAAASNVPVVAGCGGDGTLQGIATALDGSSSAFAVLPGGRCNDFAHALGLSRHDSAQKLCAVILQNKRKRVDLGAIGEKRFLTVATLGFDSEVSRFVETRNLWLKGMWAYAYGVFCTLFTFRAPMAKLSGDFGTLQERILLAATGNAPCYGGAMHITPGARLDSGTFQLCVVKDVPRLTILRILPKVLKGTHIDHPAVQLFETRCLSIETPEGPCWVCADGETLTQTPCTIEVRPGALNVIVP